MTTIQVLTKVTTSIVKHDEDQVCQGAKPTHIILGDLSQRLLTIKGNGTTHMGSGPYLYYKPTAHTEKLGRKNVFNAQIHKLHTIFVSLLTHFDPIFSHQTMS